MDSRVLAVLGPTNTGKTHLAIERMLGHESGMIGFPLRLLARENYDRIVRLRGPAAVALITGEERILPPHPRFFVSTVEAMPLDRRVAFLAIDEIQLCADPERGHVFTDRLLHARGEHETLLLGAETIRPLLRRLVPGIEFVTRPRLSRLSYSGPKKLTRLPPRSAVVAFSAAEVYAMAEVVRRQRGGAAVVLGALSPRTRNAQVGLYQAGEVDYLVATDAIGMGLNMDVDHVAFAALSKFDGRVPRSLTPAEIAQIAGRAGRHMNDGSFGLLADLAPLEPAVVEAIESHRFDPLKALSWRNSALRFTSTAALIASLDAPPPAPGLIRARDADDRLALTGLAGDPEIAALANHPETVRLLWEVCQIPDFRRTMSESHTRFLGAVYRHLRSPAGRLPTDWVAAHVARLDRVDGDIDTLVGRIAHVRTWTFVSHRGGWLEDNGHWQERTRAIEDRLSDALHERLTQRFVDRRTSVLIKRIKEGGALHAVVAEGAVSVEGQYLGRLDGFRFSADRSGDAFAARALANAAERALHGEVRRRLKAIEAEPDEAFILSSDALIAWRGAAVARLAPGDGPLRPRVEPLQAEFLDARGRERLRLRLTAWLERMLRERLGALFRLAEAGLPATARGLAYQVAEGLGSLPRAQATDLVAVLTVEERRALAALDLRLGHETLFLPALLKPAAMSLRGLLWSVHRGRPCPLMPDPGRVSVPAAPELPAGFLEAIGYRVLGGRGVRVDVLERVAAQARTLARQGPFALPPAMASQFGCKAAELPGILAGLGFQARTGETGPLYSLPRRRQPSVREDRSRESSPFAPLKALVRAP